MTQNDDMENSQTKKSRSKKKSKKEEEEKRKQEERRQRDAKREEDRRAKELRKKKDEEEKRQREIRKKAEEEKKLKEQRRLEEELRRTRLSQKRAKTTPQLGRRVTTLDNPSNNLHPPLGGSYSTPGTRHSLAAPPGPGSLQRSASFIKRALEELGEKVLRRSLSFAGDLSRDVRRSPWAASLTSLQEDAQPGNDSGIADVDGGRCSASLPRGAVPPRDAPMSSSSVAALDAIGPFARTQSLLLCRHASALDVQGLSTFSRRRLSSQGAATPSAISGSPSGLHDSSSLPGSASAGSLPWLHKFPPEEHVPEHPRYRRQSSSDVSRRSTKLRRQEAFKNDRSAIAGRSRSLTHIDALDGPSSAAASMLVKSQDMDSRSEPDTTHDRLIVPAPEPPQVRRQKLTRSQVSSSEYFSVSFEIGEPHEEFVPAEKGVSLADALSGLCARRGVDLANAHVYVDSVYKAPCQCLTTDVSLLGGKHVRVRAKDDKSPVRGISKGANNQFPTRKTAGSYRRIFSSASQEDPAYTGDSSHEGSFKGTKTSKQRWSGLFGNSKDTKMESLVELLNSYTKQGIPRLTFSDPGAEHIDESLFSIEDDWRDIVTNHNQLHDRQMHQQTAIWELVQTEHAYIRTLKVVTDLFLACLKNLQASNILNEIDTSRLFSNIINIYTSNCVFWVDAILPMLRVARDTNNLLDPSLMLEGFLKFDDVFHPYQKYCGEQLQCQLYCREKHQENEMFTAYLAWCETQKDCNRLRLMDILVKPMQRLTKYSLLLKAVHKHTLNEEQRPNLERMIRRVDEFVHNVNTTMRQREDHERLHGIIARIESYDVVDSKDDELEKLLRSYSELDLHSPMPGCHVTQRRYLLFESDLKFRDNTTGKMDVHCFLLTDMLLVCKAATKRSGGEGRMRVVRQPFVVERLMVHELGRDPPGLGVVYLNEYRTATAAFILTSGDAQLIKAWADHIRKAQDLYAAAKQASMSTSMAPTQVVTRQPSALWNDEEQEEVEVLELDSQSCASLSMGGIVSRSPRGGSSRGSRVSSLAHSHSGSMDMNEVSSVSSVSHSRGVSVENELRGSSLSSDEGIPGLPSLVGGVDAGNKGTQPPLPSASPRSDRRSILCKSPTPNTLSVQVPVYSSLGQSLPNLSLATSPSSAGHSGHPNPPTSLLLVPPSTSSKSHHHHGGLLSPGHRGVSYPPPSPPRGSLRRGFALSQNRNPPLIKTRHINSSCSSVGSAVIGAPLLSPTQGSGAVTTSFDFDVPVIAGVSPPSEECPTPEPPLEINSRSHRHPVMKRLARTENRRYHTAGAIDDLKKQNSRDSSIHKRLSWNCGQGQHHGQSGSSASTDPTGKCVSVESVHSSSGVSSTGSAQFGSLASGLEEFGSLDMEASSLQVVCENPHTCCCEVPSSLHSFSSSPSVEAVNVELLKTQLSPSPADPGGLDQPTPLCSTPVRTPECRSNPQQNRGEGSRPPSRDEMLRIKDLMLSDSSMEASNV